MIYLCKIITAGNRTVIKPTHEMFMQMQSKLLHEYVDMKQIHLYEISLPRATR